MSKFLPLLAVALLFFIVSGDPIENIVLNYIAIRSDGFTSGEINSCEIDAAVARANNPGNPNGLGNELRQTLNNKYGSYFCCFVTTGRMYTSYWYNRYNILLRSDYGDNQYIDCYRTGRFNAMDDQVELKLLA